MEENKKPTPKIERQVTLIHKKWEQNIPKKDIHQQRPSPKAVGSDLEFPSEFDERFEDI